MIDGKTYLIEYQAIRQVETTGIPNTANRVPKHGKTEGKTRSFTM